MKHIHILALLEMEKGRFWLKSPFQRGFVPIFMEELTMINIGKPILRLFKREGNVKNLDKIVDLIIKELFNIENPDYSKQRVLNQLLIVEWILKRSTRLSIILLKR